MYSNMFRNIFVNSVLTCLIVFSRYGIVRASYAPTGCSFSQGSSQATCDFSNWDPPLDESDFGPGTIYKIKIEDVDGTIPSQAFSGIDSGKNTSGQTSELRFECNLENVILSDNVFTDNLDWVEKLIFKSCYVQDGISSGMLSNLTSLEEFKVDGGIIGPLTSNSFTGLSSLKTFIIQADFLDTDIPSGLFVGLSTLEEIDLKSSGISSIASDTFTGLELLETLDISGNSLTTLPEGLFQTLRSLTTVELDSNSWDCTCDLAWLATWSIYTGVNVDVTCTTPSHYYGVTLGRAMATLGCIASISNTVSDSSGGSGSNDGGNEDSSTQQWTYIALGLAGFASLVAIATSVAMCCMCNKLSKLSPGDTNSWKTSRVNSRPSDNRVEPFKLDNSRPRSYRSSDRIYINTPIQTRRDVRHQPYIDVNYHK